MNQGLEDAAELGRQVRAEGLTQASLRAYESTRIERIQPIMAAELVSLAGYTCLLYVPAVRACCTIIVSGPVLCIRMRAAAHIAFAVADTFQNSPVQAA